jgi:hypothetical protein
MVVPGGLALAHVYRDDRTLQASRRTQAGESASASDSGKRSIRLLLELQGRALIAPCVGQARAQRTTLDVAWLGDRRVLNGQAGNGKFAV